MEPQHATAHGVLLQRRRKPSQTAKMSPRLPTTPVTTPWPGPPVTWRPCPLTSRSERDTWSERGPGSSAAQRSAPGRGSPSWRSRSRCCGQSHPGTYRWSSSHTWNERREAGGSLGGLWSCSNHGRLPVPHGHHYPQHPALCSLAETKCKTRLRNPQPSQDQTRYLPQALFHGWIILFLTRLPASAWWSPTQVPSSQFNPPHGSPACLSFQAPSLLLNTHGPSASWHACSESLKGTEHEYLAQVCVPGPSTTHCCSWSGTQYLTVELANSFKG